MKLQIKEYGNSKIIVLPTHFLEYTGAIVGDWIDMSDAFIVSDKLKQIKEE